MVLLLQNKGIKVLTNVKKFTFQYGVTITLSSGNADPLPLFTFQYGVTIT